MTGNKMSTMIISFIFCLVCSSFITSHSYCSEDSPYCTGDQDRIQQLTDEFIQKYGDEVEIRWNEDTGIPYRVRNVYPNPSDIDLDNPKGSAISFLSENSSFLGLDMDDLKYYDKSDITNGYRVEFDVSYRGVRVEYGFVRVFIYDREDGISLYIQSKYYPACLDLDPDPTVSSTGAANIVKKDLGVSRLVTMEQVSSSYLSSLYGPYYSPYSVPMQWKEVPVEPELVIFTLDWYPSEDEVEVYLAWKIICVDEPFSRTSPPSPYYYYIDAHTGEIIKSGSMARSEGTSSNSTTYNPYNTPYNTPFNPMYTPYTPYTPYNPVYNDPYNTPYNIPYTPYSPVYNPYNTPYGTPYTPYSPSIGEDWLSGNYFNMMPNYNPYGYQQPYNPYGYQWSSPFYSQPSYQQPYSPYGLSNTWQTPPWYGSFLQSGLDPHDDFNTILNLFPDWHYWMGWGQSF